jgi:RND family efflux transporter MFP subunit
MSAPEPHHSLSEGLAADCVEEPKPAPGGGRPGGKRPRATAVGVGLSVLASIAAIGVAASFTREPPPKAPEARGMTVGSADVKLAADAPQWRVLKVAPAKPAAVHWSDPVPARVRIDETHASKIGAPLEGRVMQVFVELGQPVKVGDRLFSVASPDIAGLRAEREKAAVDLEVAKTRLERIKAMVEAKALPAKDELEANQVYRQAQVSAHLAASKLASLKVGGGDNEFTVVSPRDGVVVEKLVLPSQQLQQDTPAMMVADVSSVWVLADLFEADATGITKGLRVRVTSPSVPHFSAEAEVEMVSSVVDPVRHTIPVRVRLPNPDGLLKPNIYAQMRFETTPPDGTVEIAASAIVSNGAHQYVYVEDDKGTLARRDVVVGSVREGRAPVMQGLETGELVVEEGAILLDNQIALAH